MDFYVINKDYVNELKRIDNLVGDVEYGADKLKFHLGIIIKVNDNDYYVPVSSPKPKHFRMNVLLQSLHLNLV